MRRFYIGPLWYTVPYTFSSIKGGRLFQLEVTIYYSGGKRYFTSRVLLEFSPTRPPTNLPNKCMSSSLTFKFETYLYLDTRLYSTTQSYTTSRYPIPTLHWLEFQETKTASTPVILRYYNVCDQYFPIYICRTIIDSQSWR